MICILFLKAKEICSILIGGSFQNNIDYQIILNV